MVVVDFLTQCKLTLQVPFPKYKWITAEYAIQINGKSFRFKATLNSISRIKNYGITDSVFAHCKLVLVHQYPNIACKYTEPRLLNLETLFCESIYLQS